MLLAFVYIFYRLGYGTLDAQLEFLSSDAEQCNGYLELKVTMPHSWCVRKRLNLVYLSLLYSPKVAAQVPRLRLRLKAENPATFSVTRIHKSKEDRP